MIRDTTRPCTRLTFTPAADAAPIGPIRIGKKDVRTTIAVLGRSFKPPACDSKLREIDVIRDGNQHVCVFWVGLLGCQGTYQGDATDAGEDTCFFDEPKNRTKQVLAWRRIGWPKL